MNNFNFKSFAISGIAIALVLILFKTVTAYGESHLRATSLINKRYRLTLTRNLPNCQKVNTIVLNIQQSGIYINAYLLPRKSSIDTRTQLTLTGILKNQQLELSGNIDSSIFCHNPHVKNSQVQPITILMSKINQDHIPGQLKINNNSLTLEFTALPQTKQKKPLKSQSN